MYQYQLMQARQEDLLRQAAQWRLAAQARQARTARRRPTAPAPLRRLARAMRRPATA